MVKGSRDAVLVNEEGTRLERALARVELSRSLFEDYDREDLRGALIEEQLLYADLLNAGDVGEAVAELSEALELAGEALADPRVCALYARAASRLATTYRQRGAAGQSAHVAAEAIARIDPHASDSEVLRWWVSCHIEVSASLGPSEEQRSFADRAIPFAKRLALPYRYTYEAMLLINRAQRSDLPAAYRRACHLFVLSNELVTSRHVRSLFFMCSRWLDRTEVTPATSVVGSEFFNALESLEAQLEGRPRTDVVEVRREIAVQLEGQGDDFAAGGSPVRALACLDRLLEYLETWPGADRPDRELLGPAIALKRADALRGAGQTAEALDEYARCIARLREDASATEEADRLLRQAIAQRAEAEQRHRCCCSFCSKPKQEIKKMIAGPAHFICDECIALCNDIIAENRRQGRVPPSGEGAPAPAHLCSFCSANAAGTQLISGPDVMICENCITLCNDVIAAEVQAELHPVQ